MVLHGCSAIFQDYIYLQKLYTSAHACASDTYNTIPTPDMVGCKLDTVRCTRYAMSGTLTRSAARGTL